jgi:phage terminase large subunit
MFKYTTAIEKLRALTKRIKIIQGGTSAGKTYGIIPVVIDKAQRTPKLRITVVAETMPAIKDGALQIFKEVMQDTDRWKDHQYIQNPIQYTFANGSVIQFKSFDTVGKAKAAGKRDILFLNEANHIDKEIADALMIRSKNTWIDFNPDNEFWVHTETLRHPESEFLLLTYKDNEACPEETIRDLEYKKVLARTSEYWRNWCRVYIEGEIGKLQDTIFENWKRVKERPEKFTQYVYGLDFGFVHNMAFVKIWFHERDIFVEPLIYKAGMKSRDLIDEIGALGVSMTDEIIADHARADLIAEIEDEGYYVVKANKSVQYGFDIVRGYNVFYSDDDTENEFLKYRHRKVRGELTDDPIKADDDLMDADRYGIVYIHENYTKDNSYIAF